MHIYLYTCIYTPQLTSLVSKVARCPASLRFVNTAPNVMVNCTTLQQTADQTDTSDAATHSTQHQKAR